MRDDVLQIHEIYASIQGESSFAGLPCTFVRTTGCNLRCSWCDTPQAFHGGTRLSREAVLDQAMALGTQLVELTGGEPLLQPQARPLMKDLCEAGKTVLLETEVDPTLLGGFVAEVGSRVWDASLAGQLRGLRERLIMNSGGTA